jgi:transposase-like protein
MGRVSKYPEELRERAVRMVAEDDVRRLRRQIFKASQDGDVNGQLKLPVGGRENCP